MKVELLSLLFLRRRNLIDVCEHLVYKCLGYLIFVIKNGKNRLGWFELLWSITNTDMWWDNTSGRNIIQKIERVYFLTASWLSWNQICSNTSTHTIKKEKDSIRFLQNQFNISVILGKHQHHNQQHRWLLEERLNILAPMVLGYLTLDHYWLYYHRQSCYSVLS